MEQLQAEGSSVEQVRIQLSTKDQDIELPERTGPILVPTDLKRYALSTLVNTLRETAGTAAQEPFSFLINGQFLTTSLAEYLDDNGVSAETVIDVEYVRATLPPKHAGSFVHDDWVGAVDVLSNSSLGGSAPVQPGHERIVSGSDDGLVRVWNVSGECLATSTREHDNPRALPMIKAVRLTSANTFLSAGWDMRIRHWTFGSSITPQRDFYGHTGPINDLSFNTEQQTFLTASSDNTAMLWSLDTSDPADTTILAQLSPNAASSGAKRRKASKSHDASISTHGPAATLKAHTAAVNSAIFSATDSSVAYTASSDRTLKTQDLTTAREVTSRTPLPHIPLLSVCALPALNLLAAGGTSSIALVDPRDSASTTSVLTCRGHRNAVVGLAAAPADRYSFVSASHDGTCAVWDVRNTRVRGAGDGDAAAVAGRRVAEPVWRVPRRSEESNAARKKAAVDGALPKKVFAVRWDADVGIVSGGEDCMVQIDKP